MAMKIHFRCRLGCILGEAMKRILDKTLKRVFPMFLIKLECIQNVFYRLSGLSYAATN